jgi:hypothetical protein
MTSFFSYKKIIVKSSLLFAYICVHLVFFLTLSRLSQPEVTSLEWLHRVTPHLFTLFNSMYSVPPPPEPGGGNTRLLVSVAGGPNSDDSRESLALCNTLRPHHFSLCVTVTFQQGIKISQVDQTFLMPLELALYSHPCQLTQHNSYFPFLSLSLSLSVRQEVAPQSIVQKITHPHNSETSYSVKRLDENI